MLGLLVEAVRKVLAGMLIDRLAASAHQNAWRSTATVAQLSIQLFLVETRFAELELCTFRRLPFEAS